ncbi:MAG: OsmC family protein [Salinivirgaceae bacterium]|jgi:putative redox protein|nr:OsmC family protein [Salinivirgaceae bacterium]
MKIDIERLNSACNLKATNEDGISILMDGSPEVGGQNKGLRPMQLLLASIGGCSSIDIISILQKQRQGLRDIKIEIEAHRQTDVTPALFSNITVHFILFGDIDENKAQKAVELSMDKYCSVARILEKTCDIKYSYEIKD